MLITPPHYKKMETPPGGGQGYIKNVTLQTFGQDVIEASNTALILLDFWAPWCEPCRQLAPLLERALATYKGRVILAKVNIDEQPQIAAQLRVQSIPLVMAFVKGQPVDAFMGLVSEAKLTQFIDKLLALYDAKPQSVEDARAAAEAAFNQGDYNEAATLYGHLLEQTGDASYAGPLALCYGLQGDLAQMEGLAAHLPSDNPYAQRIGDLKTLRAQNLDVLQADGSQAARFLCQAFESFQKADIDKALQGFLDALNADKLYKDAFAKLQLIKMFDILGSSHHLTLQGRRKMSALLFA